MTSKESSKPPLNSHGKWLKLYRQKRLGFRTPDKIIELLKATDASGRSKVSLSFPNKGANLVVSEAIWRKLEQGRPIKTDPLFYLKLVEFLVRLGRGEYCDVPIQARLTLTEVNEWFRLAGVYGRTLTREEEAVIFGSAGGHGLGGDRSPVRPDPSDQSPRSEIIVPVEVDEEAITEIVIKLRYPKAQLVGRETQWEMLVSTLKSTLRQNSARVVLISGPSGIGKTKFLSDEFLKRLPTRIIKAESRLSRAVWANHDFDPIYQWLDEDAIFAGWRNLPRELIVEIARLNRRKAGLVFENLPFPKDAIADQSIEELHWFEALSVGLLATRKPTVLFIDDLQWCRSRTLAFLLFLLRTAKRFPLLLVCALRNDLDLAVSNPELIEFLNTLRHEDSKGVLVEINFPKLTERQTDQLVTKLARKPIDEEQLKLVHNESEGVPLNVKDRVEYGFEKLEPLEQSSLRELRLTQLPEEALSLAKLAAVIGREFSYNLLHRSSGLNRKPLAQLISRLRQEAIFKRAPQTHDAFDFVHGQYRTTLYRLISSDSERADLHRRVAEGLEETYGDQVDLIRCQRIADQFARAEDNAKAGAYYERAARFALQALDNEQAERLITKGMAQASRVTDVGTSVKLEISLRIAEANLWTGKKGYGATEVLTAYERAISLVEDPHEHDPELLFAALWGLSACYIARADLAKAHELTLKLLDIAASSKSTDLIAVAQFTLAYTLYYRGDFLSARTKFEEGLRHYDNSRHTFHVTHFPQDVGLVGKAYLGLTHWFLGKPDTALKMIKESVEAARTLKHNYSLAWCLFALAWIHQLRSEWEDAFVVDSELVSFSTQKGFQLWYVLARMFQYRALTGLGDDYVESMIESTGDLYRKLDTQLALAYWYVVQAEMQMSVGYVRDAMQSVETALKYAEPQDQRDIFYNSETYRIKGDLLTESGDFLEAEKCYIKSLAISQSQNSLTLHLRCLVSRYRALLRQNDPDRLFKAKEQLETCYASFEEGFESEDMLIARKLIRD